MLAEAAGYNAFSKMKNVFRETPVKKYWEQKKKEKWGVWDDLLMQEESSIIERN